MYNSAIDDEDYSVVSVFNDTLDIYKTRYRKFVVDTPSWFVMSNIGLTISLIFS